MYRQLLDGGVAGPCGWGGGGQKRDMYGFAQKQISGNWTSSGAGARTGGDHGPELTRLEAKASRHHSMEQSFGNGLMIVVDGP